MRACGWVGVWVGERGAVPLVPPAPPVFCLLTSPPCLPHPSAPPTPAALALAAQIAVKEGHEGATPEAGPWIVTLDFPSYFPVMTHAKNRWGLPGCWMLAA